MEPVEGKIFWSGLLTWLFDEDRAFRDWIDVKNRVTPVRTFLDCTPEDVEGYLQQTDREAVLARARDFYGPFATHDHLREAARGGYIFFGNHLYNHYNARTLSTSALIEAYQRNRDAARRYANGVEMFSYTFGQPKSCFDQRTHAVIRSLGARRAFFSSDGINLFPENWLLNRIAMTDKIVTDSDFNENMARLLLTPIRKMRRLFQKVER